MALVLDTGVIYAARDENDADHGRCAALIASTDETLVVPSPVLVELDHWLRKDQKLGFVDAAVFCSCQALGERKVATPDRRHFSVLRTNDGRALDLLPS